MEIDISQIRRDLGSTVFFDVSENIPGFLFGTDNVAFNTPLHVQIKVHNTGKLLLVQGTIQTNLNVTCGRCLEEFIYPLELAYEDEWILRELASEDQKETAFLFDKDEVEIRDRILEQIVMALPMKFICSAECLGLCPACGVNLNSVKCKCQNKELDPRLAGLAKWRSDD
ncbi:MAG TPA: DUF177 domain-containing protein [Desulfitobacteriaceae bacterium]|nr:DUF177 domain-containing protein [Desulfitobacteriaceae bacterium]